MSDPIFQKRRLRDALLRTFGGLVVAPTLALLALASLYSIVGWQDAWKMLFMPNEVYLLWVIISLVALIGWGYAILWAALSTALSWKVSKDGVLLGLIGAVGSVVIAVSFLRFGATYYTILPSILFLLVVGAEAGRIVFARISPFLNFETLRFRRAVLEDA